ncbi:hypothetical protein TSUD_11240, partial [Trifolium subterraneum]
MSSSVSLTFTALNNPQINAISNPNARLRPLTRVRSTVARCSGTCVERKRWLGTKLRRSGSERIQFWESGGLGRLPKLRVASVKSSFSAVPEKPMGLYDPAFDKDSCGVGFVAELNGQSNRKTVTDALEMLVRMTHRGACGCEANTGDGAGILVALPH